VKRLLTVAKETELYALYVLAITTGMRQGEILGLQWRDIDLEAGMLRVQRSVLNGQISAPKTSKSRRSIGLTHTAKRALKEHPKSSKWVFCSRVGTPLSAQNLRSRSWKPLLKNADLPPHNSLS
jgi:integrase